MSDHPPHNREPTEPFTISLKRAEGSIHDLCFFLFLFSVLLAVFFMYFFYDLSKRTDSLISWGDIGLLSWIIAMESLFLYLIIQSCFVEVMMTEKYLINHNRLTKRTKRVRLDHITTYQVLRYRRREVRFLKLMDINRRSHRFVYSPEALDPYFLPKMERQRAKDMSEGKLFGG